MKSQTVVISFEKVSWREICKPWNTENRSIYKMGQINNDLK